MDFEKTIGKGRSVFTQTDMNLQFRFKTMLTKSSQTRIKKQRSRSPKKKRNKNLESVWRLKSKKKTHKRIIF